MPKTMSAISLPFRSPAREVPFEALGQPGKRDARKRDDHHAKEDGIRLERLAAVIHHVADTLAAAEHLADDDANQPERHRLPHPGEDEWDRARDDDGGEDLPVGRAVRPCRSKQIAIRRFY